MGNETSESTGTIKTTSGTPDTSPETTKDQPISGHLKECPRINGAVLIAEYIVQEIKTNVRSSTANAIRYDTDPVEVDRRRKEWEKLPPHVRKTPYPEVNMERAESTWGIAVHGKLGPIPPGKWDHKPKIRDNPAFNKVAVHRRLRAEEQNGEISKRYFHRYRDYDYFYDVWSNIHYGYVGLSVGFSEDTLLDGSDRAQKLTPGTKGSDTRDDVTAIKIGFNLYKTFGKYAEKLTSQDVLDALDQVVPSEMSYSKQIHWCWHPANTEHKPKPKEQQ